MPVIDCENKPNNNYKNKQLRTMTIAVEDWEQLRCERDELKPWAELGRLAMTIKGVCDPSEFNDMCDPNYCKEIKFCQKRKELKI
jgi:hypothetical protein